ncbi:MAG: hypothetical protein E7283_07145 [Lachnospiraceae bacterium]|nr:hypothetical protein [Lachnospiraceae bacterium]
MSQAKVDKYKAEKANRKEIMAKEKRQKMLIKIVGSVIGIALVAWIGVSAGVAVYNSRPVDKIYVTTADLDDYLNELYEDETEESTDKEDSKEETK